ncbi:MAG: response regulator transcription factor [Nitrospirae bacterium]|nr:MAG: response regulator transcription factor [Nitrospirota bacterium]
MTKKENKKNNKTGVMIVDDHPFVRYGISQLIGAAPDLEVCCEAGSYREALEKLKESKPNLAIIDLSLKDVHGIELIKTINRRYPAIPMLVLSMHDEFLYAERSIRAGARGYVMKQEGTEILITAIRRILSGHIFVSPDISSKLIAKQSGHAYGPEMDSFECLSDRELEVFELLGNGHKTSRIAEALNLSVKTIETYRSNIKNKLGLSDSSELLQKATLWVKSIEIP